MAKSVQNVAKRVRFEPLSKHRFIDSLFLRLKQLNSKLIFSLFIFISCTVNLNKYKI